MQIFSFCGYPPQQNHFIKRQQTAIKAFAGHLSSGKFGSSNGPYDASLHSIKPRWPALQRPARVPPPRGSAASAGLFVTAAETQPTCRAQVQLLELEKRKKSKYDGPGLHGEGLKVVEFREQDGASSKLRWLNHDEGSDGWCSGSYRGGGGVIVATVVGEVVASLRRGSELVAAANLEQAHVQNKLQPCQYNH